MTATWTAPKTWAAEVLSSADMNTHVRDNTEFLKINIALDAAAGLTIDAGAVTVTQSYHKIAGEGAADDSLDTITGGSEGQVIILRPDGDVITLKDGVGNLVLGADVILSLDTDHVMLIFSADSNWHLFNRRRHHAFAFAKLDLSGSAQADVPILHTSVTATLINATLLYTEASSGDAGVVVTIGKETDDNYYYTGTSEVSKALWYEKDVTLLATDVAAGDTVVCGNAGGKSGTGEILVCIEYAPNE